MWVHDMIHKHHDAAKAKGVKIIHCCSYSCVPSDLGAWFVVDYMMKKFGKYGRGKSIILALNLLLALPSLLLLKSARFVLGYMLLIQTKQTPR